MSLQPSNPNLVPQNPSYNTYIGSRYVPVFADTPGAEWDNTKVYEPLTIVTYQGDSYTSRTYVPAGADIMDQKYWVQTGNFNAQLEDIKRQLKDFGNLKINRFAHQFDTANDRIKANELWLNPLMFGAKGDGFYDDTAAVQECVQKAEELNAGVFFPSGTYLLTAPITITKNTTSLKGGGARNTRIKASTSTSLVVITATSASNIIGVNISDLFFDGAGVGINGIDATWAGMLHINDCVFSHFQKCIALDHCWMASIDNIYAVGSQLGVYSSVGDGSAFKFCVLENNDLNLQVDNTAMLMVYSCTLQLYTKTGNALFNGSKTVTIQSCWFEPSKSITDGYDIMINPMSGTSSYDFVIMCNHFHSIWGDGGVQAGSCIVSSLANDKIMFNSIDDSVSKYASGMWYQNIHSNARTILLGNVVLGTDTASSKYSIRQNFANNNDDFVTSFNQLNVVGQNGVLPVKGFYYGDTAPTTGSWNKGDIAFSTNPTTYVGWVCTASGTPGTWKTFGPITQ